MTVLRRFALGSEAAFAGLVAGGAIAWLALRNEEPPGKLSWVLAAGVPSLSGVALVALVTGVGSVSGEGHLRRPLTWTLPLIHTALTALVARALLTGPAAAVAPPAGLMPAALWLNPLALILLFAGEYLLLELATLRPRPDTAR